MEMVGGFMVMMSILGFFLVVIWLIMPFVVLTIKGKLDRTLDVLAGVERRLAVMETQLTALQHGERSASPATAAESPTPPAGEKAPPDASLPLA
jgi:hypothetical protein